MRVIGYCCASAVAPENTMAAFRAAVELGVGGIEFDVQQTVDGQFVVIHDAMLDRATSSKGPVFETAAEAVGGSRSGSVRSR